MNFTSALLLFSVMSTSGTKVVAVDNSMSPIMQDMLKEKRTDFSELDIGSSIMEINKHLENTSAWEHIVGGDVKVGMYRSAKKCPKGHSSCLWPRASNGIVYIPFVYKTYFGVSMQKQLQMAFDEFGFLTCIKFIRRAFEANYIELVSRSGCTSTLGPVGGPQIISLQIPGCLKFSTIQHHFMHTIGFYHEHTRSDRDSYIEIKYNNIRAGKNIQNIHYQSYFPHLVKCCLDDEGNLSQPQLLS
ncbi:low choriolytic enzyme-like [Scyliorhinus canicula]|uniref:low choriolytic enzyme-like n=1 Tax=Scyliorhinus canicula TaxID=7830 RepID=UPI0018F51CCD|nr:low choriolytic enzyme-like [Scyliorhinus canicula]